MEQKVGRFAALAGILFLALVLVGFAIEGSTPDTGDAPGEIVEFYADNDARVKASSALAVVGAVALVLFGAHLASAMRARGSTLLSTVAVGGAVVAAAGIGVDSALRFAIADAAGDISPEATEAMFATWSTFFWPMHLGMVVLVLAVSLHSFDSPLIPSWLAGVGILAAICAVIPVIVVLIIGVIGLAIWVVITSVLVYRQPAASG